MAAPPRKKARFVKPISHLDSASLLFFARNMLFLLANWRPTVAKLQQRDSRGELEHHGQCGKDKEAKNAQA